MMLFFLCFLIMVILLIVFICFSNIKISIINLEIDSNIKSFIKDYNIEFAVCIFKKFKITKITINEEKINSLKTSKFFNKMYKNNFNNFKQQITNKITDNLAKKYINNDIDSNNKDSNNKDTKLNTISYVIKLPKIVLKNLKPDIEQFRLYIIVGSINIFTTTFLVPLISTLISLVLKSNTRKIRNIKKENKYYYKIEPEYNQNIIKLKSSCIINIKIIHIIKIIFMFL